MGLRLTSRGFQQEGMIRSGLLNFAQAKPFSTVFQGSWCSTSRRGSGSSALRATAPQRAFRWASVSIRASCGSTARGDLCGGCRATSIPTATVADLDEQYIAPLLSGR